MGDVASRDGAVTQMRGTFTFNINHAVIGCIAFALAAVADIDAAAADDDFALTGSYTQNVPCKGDGSDAKDVLVTISAQEIVSNMGVCTILNTKHEGNTFTEHVECKLAGGPIMGDISFTPRPDKTVDFVDRDGNYKAILHRCPN
jgi:hypothetical protein